MAARRFNALIPRLPARRGSPGGAPSLVYSTRRFASQDYGSGAGDPKGENPQAQGKNPREDLEHPGPPPPSTGNGGASADSKGSSNGQPQPKVNSPGQPSEGGEAAKHNEELKARQAKSHSTDGKEEKVEKGFWKGEGDQ